MADANTISVAKLAASGGGTAWSTTETIFVQSANTSKAAQAFLPGSGKLDGKSFKVKAVMAVTGGVTTNFTGRLYFGTSTTVASNRAIATSGAVAFNNGSGSVELVAVCSWDSLSNKISGFYEGNINNTAVTQAALTNAPSATTSVEGYAFCASGQFSVSSSGNVAKLTELTISAQ